MKRIASPYRCARAFTLVEVLIALLLIGIVLPAIMKAVSVATLAAGEARHKLQATSLAQTKLAEIVADAADQVQAGALSGDFGEEYPAYRWEASSQNVGTNLSEVLVRVMWMSRGSERSVFLESFAFTGASSSTSAVPGGTR